MNGTDLRTPNCQADWRFPSRMEFICYLALLTLIFLVWCIPAEIGFHFDGAAYYFMGLNLIEKGTLGGSFTRLPLLPALIAATLYVDPSLHLFYLIQSSFLPLSALAFVFFLRPATGFRPAMLISLFFFMPGCIYPTRCILTEPLSMFLTALLLCCLSHALRTGNLIWMGSMSALTGLLLLTKPVFLILAGAGFLLFFLSLAGKPAFLVEKSADRSFRNVMIAIILASGGSVGLVIIGNYCRMGEFTYCPQIGFNLSNKIGDLVTDTWPEFGPIVPIYLQHRDKVIRETGSHAQAIWLAMSQLRQTSQKSYATLNRVFLRIGLHTIARSPGGYLRSVANSIGRGFLLEPNLATERSTLLFPVHVILLASGLIGLFLIVVGRFPGPALGPEFYLAALLLASIYATNVLIEYGDDFRLLTLPLPFLYGFGATFLWRCFCSWRRPERIREDLSESRGHE